MSWSLQIRNGDLSTGSNQLGSVTGVQKLIQDLRSALLEPKGFDLLHPEYGSLLDGGRNDSGAYVSSVIGETDSDALRARIQSEIMRIANRHQTLQISRSRQDRATFGQSTLSPGELLKNVSGISFFQVQDALIVKVLLTTGNSSVVSLVVPIPGTVMTN